jgi:YVTN family beta-propeller protein
MLKTVVASHEVNYLMDFVWQVVQQTECVRGTQKVIVGFSRLHGRLVQAFFARRERNPRMTLNSKVAVPLLLGLLHIGSTQAQPYAYVANLGADSVSVIDTPSSRVVATVAAGAQPDGVAASPDGRRVYVASFADNTVAIIDTATNTVTGNVPVGNGPVGLAASADGGRLYVANRGDNTVSVVDTASNAVVAVVAVGAGPDAVAVTPDGGAVYVTNSYSQAPGSVSVIDTATSAVTATVAVLRNPNRVAIGPDGRTAYVTNFRSWNVSVIDVATRNVSALIRIFGRPSGVVLSPDGAFAYVVTLAGRVQVVDTAANTVIASIGVGARPFGAAALDTIGYVANFDSDTVSIVDLVNQDTVASLPVGHQPFAVAINCVGTACHGPVITPKLTPTFTPTAATPATATPTSAPTRTLTVPPTRTPTKTPTPNPNAVTIGPITVSGAPGQEVGFNITYTGPTDANGLTFNILYPASAAAVYSPILRSGSQTIIQCSTAPDLDTNISTSAVLLSSGKIAFTVLGASFSTGPVPFGRTGVVGTCKFTIAAGASGGSVPLLCDTSAAATTASDVNGNDLPATCVDGTVTVGGQVAVPSGSDHPARAARTNAAVLPGAATLCAGGERDGSPCATDADCPQGACALALGVCDGGSNDGLLCDCPGGTCSAGPSCSADPMLGTCSGGPAAAQCCDTSFNCAGRRPCVATQKVCAGGLAKGMPCLSDSQCPDGVCAVSGRLCAGGDFDRVACVDRGDCPRGACLAPGESVLPTATATATPTPQAPAPSAATGPVGGDGCSIGARVDSDAGTGWIGLAGGLVVIWIRRYRTRQ